MNQLKNMMMTVHWQFVDYPSPSNFSYWWGFGSLSGFSLIIQIVSGIFLAMHYTPNINLAYISIEHIMRENQTGWLLRNIHANGASLMFIVVGLHTFRSLYFYSSASILPRAVFIYGWIIFLLLLATAFLGYVLVWSQMSFWAATVITSLASTIPIIGNELVIQLWGGHELAQPTLNRIFSLHYLCPILIAAVALVHIVALHQYGSTHPLQTASLDKIGFIRYYIIKDLVGLFSLVFLFSFLIFWNPYFFSHPDLFEIVNTVSTPVHIVPEWYFLAFYALLRALPNKLAGVCCLLLWVICLLFFSTKYQFRSMVGFLWFFAAHWIILSIAGTQTTDHAIRIAKINTGILFLLLGI